MNKIQFKRRTAFFLAPLISSLVMALQVHAAPAPCIVPLQLVELGSSKDKEAGGKQPEYKLGINVALGDGGTPQLYEFDTGGGGFWAAWNDTSPWIGKNITPVTTNGSFSNHYSSGNDYSASNLVAASISLYGSPDASGQSAVVCSSAGPLNLVQIGTFNNTKDASKVTRWNDRLKKDKPPLFGYFYGDFGAALHPVMSSDPATQTLGSYTLLPQMVPAGLINGFIVHVGALGRDTQPTLQIGLSASDINSFSSQITMNPFCTSHPGSIPASCSFPNNGSIPTFSEQVMTANISWGSGTNALQQYSTIGVTIDTGAPTTTIWQNVINSSDYPLFTVDNGFLDNPSFSKELNLYTGSFASGVNVAVTDPKNSTNTWNFNTSDYKVAADTHDKTGKAALGYMNTGLAIFTGYDVMFNLQNGTVGFRPSVNGYDINCALDWAEDSYGSTLAPATSGAVSTQVMQPYTYRYYKNTDTYLGVSSSDNHVYMQTGANGSKQDLGSIYTFLSQSGCM